MTLCKISRQLSSQVDALVERYQTGSCPIAAYVYNPLAYARSPHEQYLKRYGTKAKEVLLLGMNPGPFGMAQTGVPFGDVTKVRDFLGIEGPVGRPPCEHPKRPINGFDCTRSEVSGSRLWGWAEERFGTAELFFERFFVVNYCPLVFMEESSRNLTPDKLPREFREELFDLCDQALQQTVAKLQPQWVLGVGGFARKRAQISLEGNKCEVGTILHPSPASPAANRGWAPAVEKQLTQLGIAF